MASSSDDSPRRLGLGGEDLTDRRSFKPNGGTVFLNITSGYLSGKPEWAAEKGFREICQNCVDEILDTNGLSRDQIIFRITDPGDDFLALILPASQRERGQSQAALGWIYFNKGLGMVEVINCNARLPRKVLDIGFSTKMGDTGAAGGFGEGLKVGALALCHYGYQVEIVSSGFKWRFKSETPDPEMRMAFIVISLHSRPRTQTDCQERAELLKPKEVYKYQLLNRLQMLRCGSEIFIRVAAMHPGKSPTQLFGSPYGSIILDDHLCGSIYVKGLLITSGSRQAEPGYEGKRLKWGYNFSEAALNRDRNMTCNEREIAEKRAKVIDAAINQGNDGSVQVLKDYVDILQDSESRYIDADGTEDFAPRRLARSIWGVLKAKALEQNLFYYDRQNGTEAEMIAKDLKKEPAPVSNRLMKLLKKHSLACTPHQRMIDQLQAAKDSDKEVTGYFATLKRLLSAALASDSSTSDYTMQWKSGDETEHDFFIWTHTPSIVISDKFGDFRRGHMGLPCTLSRADAEAVKTSHFSCDHLIVHLYSRFLETVRSIRQKQNLGPMDTDANLRFQMTGKLSQMPRQVQSKTSRAGEIVVTWVDKESCVVSELHGLDYECRVTLYCESTCASKRNDLLGYAQGKGNFPQGQYNADCGCPEQLVYLKDRQATFSGLIPAEKYFPMVARTKSQAFYGEPPEGISPIGSAPKQTEVRDPVTQKQARPTTAKPDGQTKVHTGATTSATRKQPKVEQSEQSKQQRRLKTQSKDNSTKTRLIERAVVQTEQADITETADQEPWHLTQTQLEDLIGLFELKRQALIDRLEGSLGSGGQEAPGAVSAADKEDLEQRVAAISNELDQLKLGHDGFLTVVENALQGIQDATETTKVKEDQPEAASNIPEPASAVAEGALDRSKTTAITAEFVENMTPRHQTILRDVRALKADHTVALENISSIRGFMQTFGAANLTPVTRAAASSLVPKRQLSEDLAGSSSQPTSKKAKVTESS